MDSREVLAAELAGRYAIQREVGQGGMAIVFLAEDLRHRRPVAIKVLRPELVPMAGAERFLREIEIAARLTYPHILPLLDSGTAGGLLYYVMPYVEGLSLRDRLARESQLSLEETVRIGTQVAGALEYAHALGVIHRDIKPENILLSGGQALVSDFGIARGLASAGGPSLTSTGMVLGTPAYMSPEQGAGAEVDARTDVYALGCVLFEALAGQPPFTAATPQQIQARHHFDAVPPLRSIRPNLPAGVDEVLQRALAKAPADRFASAKDFSEALARAAGSAVAPPMAHAVPTSPPAHETSAATVAMPPRSRTPAPPRSRRGVVTLAIGVAALVAIVGWLGLRGAKPSSAIAGPRDWIIVADFEGPANDPELATAARELLSAALDQSGIVVTVPRDRLRQALRRAGKPDSVRVDPELAAELAYRSSIRSIVAGRIQRLGESYNTVVRVLDAESSAVRITLDETARDSKDLVSSLSRLAQKLRRSLGESRDALRATRPLIEVTTPSLDAFRWFVRAGDLVNRGLSEEAIRAAREALALDPGFAAAWRAIAVAHLNNGSSDSAYAAFHKCLEHPERLEEWRRLDVEAQIAALEGDLGRALSAWDRALRLMPQYPGLKNNYALRLQALGRVEEARDTLVSALDDDPMGPSQVLLGNLHESLTMLDRFEEARQVESRMEPSRHRFYSMSRAVAAGSWNEADSTARVIVEDPSTPPFLRALAATDLASGRSAGGHLHELLAPDGMPHPILTLGLASIVDMPLRDPERILPPAEGSPVRAVVQAWLAILEKRPRVAERTLAEIGSRSAPTFLGFWPEYLGALLRGQTGHWDETVRRLAPVARSGIEPTPGWRMPTAGRALLRVSVAEAYEQLGQPDSAAAFYEQALSRDRLPWLERLRVRAVAPYVHRRLALLELKRGRLEDAERHAQIYFAAMANADPELRPSVEELRRAFVTARAMEPRRL